MDIDTFFRDEFCFDSASDALSAQCFVSHGSREDHASARHANIGLKIPENRRAEATRPTGTRPHHTFANAAAKARPQVLRMRLCRHGNVRQRYQLQA